MHSDGDDSMLARMAAFAELAAIPGERGAADDADAGAGAGDPDGSHSSDHDRS